MSVFPITDIPHEGMTVKANFSTEIVKSRSGREQRRALYSAPLHDFSLTWEEDTAAAITAPLWAFYVARKGSYESFTYVDYDAVRAWDAVPVGVGTGAATVFDLPAMATSSRTLYLDGSTTGTGGSLGVGTGTDGRDQWTFTVAPAAAQVITCDLVGQRVFLARFAEDSLSYSAFAVAVYATGVKIIEVLA